MKCRYFSSAVLFVLFLLLLAGCGTRAQIQQVEREDLFTLDIGILEDQIALFNLEGDGGIRQTGFAMRDGLFYIADGNGGKILRYNSYGDLLFMIYNEETNPPPMTLKPLAEGSLVTRWAAPYPLQEPSEITVDSRKHIYVRDRLPYERHSFDPESRSLLDSVILHFDENGQFVEYLGREGVGGTPFPRIEGIFTSQRDDLAVVCRLSTGWNIYWYDSRGSFRFMIPLKNEAVPVPPDRDNVIPSLDMISVSPDARRINIKVDYYVNTFDESTNIKTGIEPDSSVIWIMNAETGVWEHSIDVPFFEDSSAAQNGELSSKRLYSFLGSTKDGGLYLYSPVEGGYSILVMSAEAGASGEQRRGFIRVDSTELQFNVFDLSADGILSGLLADDWQVKLVWWRTDRFLGDSPLE